jgi:DNA-binding HxlR family transcriptional regulator
MGNENLKELRHYLQEKECPDIYHNILLIEDTLDVLAGKWKDPILFAVLKGNSRFTDILNFCHGLTDKVLNSKLKELIENRMIEKECNQYHLTEHGVALYRVMEELWSWGARHRRIMLE